jgi:hypothetical protein
MKTLKTQRRTKTVGISTVAIALVVFVVWLIQHHTSGTTADKPAPAPDGPPSALLAQLTVAVPDTGAHYNRADWGDWIGQGNSCDTRAIVLKQQDPGVQTAARCKINAGKWTSPYDGVVVTDAKNLDIDHIVPVKEANSSGARDWTPKQRSTFYNDSENLVAVSFSSNRSKGDSDPAHWRPTRAYWCDYATRYTTVKARYHLTVDQDERAALAQMLGTCSVAP